MEINNFLNKFKFSQEKCLFLGIEREGFISKNGLIQPIAPEVIRNITCTYKGMVSNLQEFGYELSACQLEMKYGPLELEAMEERIKVATFELDQLEKKFGFKIIFSDVAPTEIPLDVYPDPTGRYQIIEKNLSKEVLRAACIVAGTHVHVGMPDVETAIHVYNNVIGHISSLSDMGDNSSGDRLNLYSLMAPESSKLSKFDSKESWFEDALQKNYAEDPRKCWTLIRISIHGTIEFRMFGSTSNTEDIFRYAKTCHGLCREFI